MLDQFAIVLFFILVGFGFIFANLFLGWLLRLRHPNPLKGSPYECGEKVIGSSYIRFNIRFYIVALIFIIFDVEVVALFPWALVYKELFPTLGWIVFAEAMVFIGILVVGLAYVWQKGDLGWVTISKQEGERATPAVPAAEPKP
ncbi:MAG: NADH-quinone oxidoreductase subunit A [Planctomycetes bacterium]|nr:NADH-quinone oxidoreductase subunit A [Planctomycetota bacterium]